MSSPDYTPFSKFMRNNISNPCIRDPGSFYCSQHYNSLKLLYCFQVCFIQMIVSKLLAVIKDPVSSCQQLSCTTASIILYRQQLSSDLEVTTLVSC